MTEQDVMLALKARLQPTPEDPSYVEDELYPGPIDIPQNTRKRPDLDNTALWECQRCKGLDRTEGRRNDPQLPLRAPLVEKQHRSPQSSPEKIGLESSATPFNPSDWLQVQEHSWSTDLFDQPISFVELRWIGGGDQDKENTSPNTNNDKVEYLLPITHTEDSAITCTPQAL